MTTTVFNSTPENGTAYSAAKMLQLEKASTIRILGTILPIDNGVSDFLTGKKKGLIPILGGCICVQDSPENPCPCTGRPPIIIWCPTDKILRSEKSKFKNHDGTELIAFDIQKDAEVFLEAVLPVSLNGLKKLSQTKNGHSSPASSTIAKEISKTGNPVVDAFLIGWGIGTAIDEATGASDAIADWLHDTFGEWPW